MKDKAEAILERMARERGDFVMQGWRRQLAERDPEFMELWHNLINYALVKERALPRKYKEIIAVVMDALTGYNPGLKIHARAALESGATEEELLEALEMASCLGIHYVSIPMPAFVEAAEEFKEK